MAKRYSLEETLDFILDQSDSEEGPENTEQDNPEEDFTTDTEDETEFEEDCHQSEEEDCEEEGHVDEIYLSKNGNITWNTTPPPQRPGRASAARIMKLTPGPTRYACSHVEDIKSAFLLFFPMSIQKILIEMTNLEGKRVYGDGWNDVDWTEIEAFFGLMLLAGVYRSRNEALASLWDAESGRSIFQPVMSLKKFKILSRILRFDNKDTRECRHETDKLAAIRDVWDLWVERLPLM